MARAIDGAGLGWSAELSHEACREGEELRVSGAGQHQRGHGAVRQLTPPRRIHGAGAGESERRRQTGRGVGHAGRPVLRRDVQPGEERLGEPTVQEGRHPCVLDPIRQRTIGSAPVLPGLRAADAGGGAQQDQTTNPVRMVEGGPQRQAPAHGVADVDRRTAGGHQRGCAFGQIGPSVAGQTVARRIHRQDPVISSQVSGDRAPTHVGLGEAVDQDEPRPGATGGDAG